MRVKIVILILSMFFAFLSQAQVPSPKLWWASGDSLYPVHNNIWVKGDSLHFTFASFDSLSGVNLDSLGRIQIDTLTVNDTLNIKGPGLFEELIVFDSLVTIDDSLHIIGNADFDAAVNADSIDSDHGNIVQMSGDSLDLNHILLGVNLLGTGAYADLDSIQSDHYTGTNIDLSGWLNADSIDSNHGNIGILDSDSIESRAGNFTGNVRVADTTFCDYYEGLSPMYFLSPSYFSYLSADTIEATITIAPTFSMTDLGNTQGYWDIIAGPDSLEWTEQANVVAGHDMSELMADADTLYSISKAGTTLHIASRNPDTGVWSSVAAKTVGSSGSRCDFVFGAGDSIHVTWAGGGAVHYSCWDGSSWVNDHTIITSSYYNYAVSIARHTDGTIYALGTDSSEKTFVWEYSGGTWSAVPDTLYTGSDAQINYNTFITSTGVAHACGPASSQFHHYYDDGTTDWADEVVRNGSWGTMEVDSNDDLWAAIYYSSKVYLLKNTGGGWIPQDTVSTNLLNSYNWFDMTFNSADDPYLAYYDNSDNDIKFLYWDGSNMISDPMFSAAGRDFPSISFFGSTLAIMGSDGSNEDVFLQTSDPGFNTGHRNGALLIRTNMLNDAADIYIQTDSTIHLEGDTIFTEGDLVLTEGLGLSSEGITCVGDAGVASLDVICTFIETDAGGDDNMDTVTVADGFPGQVKMFFYTLDTDTGDSLYIEPANGEHLFLEFELMNGTYVFDGVNWVLTGNIGGIVP